MRFKQIIGLILFLAMSICVRGDELSDIIWANVDSLHDQVVGWRRDIHQHPELSNREFRTAKLVARQLRKVGIEVQSNIAHAGVVGILKGGKPGPVVAFRADMDAIPVTEKTGLPFASKKTAKYNGEDVGVMHACGHDAHTAILLGAATVLSQMREQLAGTVMFIFQPAEEGPPEGEIGGATLMLSEGLFESLRPDAVFALHVTPDPSGKIFVREGVATAGSSSFSAKIIGKQTHSAMPWLGVDPIIHAAQIVSAWQSITSRYIDVTAAQAPLLTVGTIRGGSRHNIIPEQVELSGTVRYYHDEHRDKIFSMMQGIAKGIAESVGAKLEFEAKHGYIPVINNTDLVGRARSLLAAATEEGVVHQAPIVTAGEDFSFFAREVPGLIFILGAAPQGRKPMPNHSPMFTIDESAMRVGVRAWVNLAVGMGRSPTPDL